MAAVEVTQLVACSRLSMAASESGKKSVSCSLSPNARDTEDPLGSMCLDHLAVSVTITDVVAFDHDSISCSGLHAPSLAVNGT